MARLDTHHLEIVRAVAREGSLTAAAEALHLTQSALSHTVKKLEDQLGVALWRRENRSLKPTQAGEYLLAVAERLLPQLAHAEERLGQFASGERGRLRIGMECHPCYQWLQKVISPYLGDWPAVDLDVRQKFQFGGLAALFGFEIDLLVTPDPLYRPGLSFVPVFDYEQVLAVGPKHRLRGAAHAVPEDLAGEVLITYPVARDRLDIYTRFLIPAGVAPRLQKPIETTEIMLQMVAHDRGVAALPRWLVEESARGNAGGFDIAPVRLGATGIDKQIFLGFRESDAAVDYLRAFVETARGYGSTWKPGSGSAILEP